MNKVVTWIKENKIKAGVVLLICVVLYNQGYLKVTNPDNPFFIRSMFSFQDYSDNSQSKELGYALSRLIKQWEYRTQIDKMFFETNEIERATRSNKVEDRRKLVPEVAFTVTYLPRMTLIECVATLFSPNNCYYNTITAYYDNDESLLNMSVHGRLIFPTIYDKPPRGVFKQIDGKWMAVPIDNKIEGEK